MELYNYKATVLRVIDGDTIEIAIDMGFNITNKQIVRINGIDTPELHTDNPKEYKASRKVMQYVKDTLLNKTILVETIKYNDKYGRYLADIKLEDNTSFNQQLVQMGFALSYDGGTKQEWTDELLDQILNNEGSNE